MIIYKIGVVNIDYSLIIKFKRKRRFSISMPITLYKNSSLEQPTIMTDIIREVFPRFHYNGNELEFFNGLLSIVNSAPFPVALIEGIPRGSPMDPSPDTVLAKKYGLHWVGFDPQNRERWQVIEHKQYMAIPHNGTITPVTPLYCVERHRRRDLGCETPLKTQNFHAIRFDQGRSQGASISYDMEGIRAAMMATGIDPDHSTLDKQLTFLHGPNMGKYTTIEHAEIGSPQEFPQGISSGQIREIRDRITEYVYGQRRPAQYKDEDFWSAGLADLIDSRPHDPYQPRSDDINVGNWMEGFNGTRITFIDPFLKR